MVCYARRTRSGPPMLYKQKGSKNWYVKLKHRGQVIRESTRTAVKRDARQHEKILRKHLQDLRKQSDYTFADAAHRWLDEKYYKRSIKGDAFILEWLRPHLEHVYLSEITRDMVEDLRKLKRETCST